MKKLLISRAIFCLTPGFFMCSLVSTEIQKFSDFDLAMKDGIAIRLLNKKPRFSDFEIPQSLVLQNLLAIVQKENFAVECRKSYTKRLEAYARIQARICDMDDNTDSIFEITVLKELSARLKSELVELERIFKAHYHKGMWDDWNRLIEWWSYQAF